MTLEVFRVNEIGELTVLRLLSADKANTDVFKNLHPWSHYNSSLFLRKSGCFSADLYPQVDELLEHPNFPQLCQCTDSNEELQSVPKKDTLDA